MNNLLCGPHMQIYRKKKYFMKISTWKSTSICWHFFLTVSFFTYLPRSQITPLVDHFKSVFPILKFLILKIRFLDDLDSRWATQSHTGDPKLYFVIQCFVPLKLSALFYHTLFFAILFLLLFSYNILFRRVY